MRMNIGSFICSLIMVSNVYAAPLATNDQVISESNIVAATAVESSTEDLLPMPMMNGIKSADIVSEGVKKQQDQAQPQAKLDSQVQPLEAIPVQQLPVIAQKGTNVVLPATVTADQTIKDLTERLVVLETKNTKLQGEVTQMNGRMNLIEERIIGHVGEQKTPACSWGIVGKYIDRLKSHLGPQLFIAIVLGIVVVFLFLLAYIIFPRYRNPLSVNYPQDDTLDKEQGFNQMAGQDSVAAKINLARAYIEMGHESKAQGMLYDVLAHGSDVEQEEAKELLEKIKHPDVTS